MSAGAEQSGASRVREPWPADSEDAWAALAVLGVGGGGDCSLVIKGCRCSQVLQCLFILSLRKGPGERHSWDEVVTFICPRTGMRAVDVSLSLDHLTGRGFISYSRRGIDVRGVS